MSAECGSFGDENVEAALVCRPADEPARTPSPLGGCLGAVRAPRYPHLVSAVAENELAARHLRLDFACEIIPQRLYLVPWDTRGADAANAVGSSFETSYCVMPPRCLSVRSQGAVATHEKRSSWRSTIFSIEDDLCYEPFFADFGPHNLAHTVRFVERVDGLLAEMRRRHSSGSLATATGVGITERSAKARGSHAGVSPTDVRDFVPPPPPCAASDMFCVLTDASSSSSTFTEAASGPVLLFTCAAEPEALANAAVLIGAYAILRLHRTPEQALCALTPLAPYWKAFRDASCGYDLPFHLDVSHCLRAWHKAAHVHNLFQLDNFDLDEYEFFEQVENGDLNWVVPGKLLAFSGPTNNSWDAEGVYTCVPEDYIPYFLRENVTAVVRLNKRRYDARKFTAVGIRHYELYFADGACPDQRILDNFLGICEREPGAVAIHCKAGLGRTGTLICCYLMNKYQFSAHEAIAWCRLCRPGSVLGPQQHFLVQVEPVLRQSVTAEERGELDEWSAATRSFRTDQEASAEEPRCVRNMSVVPTSASPPAPPQLPKKRLDGSSDNNREASPELHEISRILRHCGIQAPAWQRRRHERAASHGSLHGMLTRSKAQSLETPERLSLLPNGKIDPNPT
ncbi:hypothetical protein CDCA_CDCA01G0296 [Cyanidium caldarium]|uniref:protein-tyrosine-phosphatase n=1 Tax=Cyanidium caldarium TaxID=2771 RepID=A0AAV9IQB4_CYACA|nr:hypothetical protein CDCA_CDCA01G0296 [Cyanidium caldarium]